MKPSVKSLGYNNWYKNGRRKSADFNLRIGDFTMKNIIEELFYGNIDPQARCFKKDSYLQKQMTIMSHSEEILTERLKGDDKKTFLSFVNASGIVLGESELDSFIVGFRLGARSIYDTFVDNTKPYDDFLKEVTNEG